MEKASYNAIRKALTEGVERPNLQLVGDSTSIDPYTNGFRYITTFWIRCEPYQISTSRMCVGGIVLPFHYPFHLGGVTVNPKRMRQTESRTDSMEQIALYLELHGIGPTDEVRNDLIRYRFTVCGKIEIEEDVFIHRVE